MRINRSRLILIGAVLFAVGTSITLALAYDDYQRTTAEFYEMTYQDFVNVRVSIAASMVAVAGLVMSAFGLAMER